MFFILIHGGSKVLMLQIHE